MNKFKKLTLLLTFFSFAIILFLSDNAYASTPESDAEAIIKKIAPDGENAVFKVKKPTTIEEGDLFINGYVNSLVQADGYEIYAYCMEEPYTTCVVDIYNIETEWSGSYTINVTYDEPKANSVVDGYFSKLNNSTMNGPGTYYFVEDLSLINYYLTSNKSELWNPGAPGRALKYSTLNNVTGGSNVTYYLDVRAGMQDETLMYESAFGPMSIFYNGYSYGTKEEGLYLKRVIYIPSGTENTKEAYVAAAQKKINDYLGNGTSAVVSYGGALSSLPEFSEDPDYPIANNDGNYYNIKIGTRTYKFYIVKGTDEQLVQPTYAGLDLASNIAITSEDSSIPLDTSLTVKNIQDSSIKDKIGTDNYKSYDISLYSDAKGTKVEKLSNGKFTVKIPVPSELNGKELVVYYITTTGDKEEHEVTVVAGNAVFTTDHFSTYTLAEKVSTTESAKPADTTKPVDTKKPADTTKSDVSVDSAKDTKGNAVTITQSSAKATVEKEAKEEAAKIKNSKVVATFELTAPEGTDFPLTITLKVAGITSKDTVKILHKKGTEWETIDATTGDGKVTFKVNSLSPISIVKVSDSTAKSVKSPKTGEKLPVALVISVIAMAGIVYTAKKSRA